MEAPSLAGFKKNAIIRGQTIVFIDESGLTEKPNQFRTWAPRGQTPILQYHFNWKRLSAIAGVSFWNFYFRLFPGSIKEPQVVEFLRHLLRHIKGKLLIIWDGLRVHRGKVVREYIKSLDGRVQLEFLPAYAPELNPVEYLWGYWKHHELPNFCPKDFSQLSIYARKALCRIQRRPTVVTAFWKQAKLFDQQLM